MEENIECCICYTGIVNKEELCKTPCNHIFHKECLKQIIRPFCPMCKKILRKTLYEIGLSAKKIKQNIDLDNFRIDMQAFLNNQNYEELDSIILMHMAIISKLTFTKNWKEIYIQLLCDIVSNAGTILQEIINIKNKLNEPSIFVIRCNLSDIIENMALGYYSSLLQIYSLKVLKRNRRVAYHIKKIQERIKNKENNLYSLLFIIDDDIIEQGPSTYITTKIFSSNTFSNFPNYKCISKSLCEGSLDCTYRSSPLEINKNSCEYMWAQNILNGLKNNIQSNEIMFKTLNEFLNKIESYFENNVNINFCKVTCIYRSNVDEPYVFYINKNKNKNNNVYIYSHDEKKKSKITTNYIKKYIIKNIGINKKFLFTIYYVQYDKLEYITQYVCAIENKLFVASKLRIDQIEDNLNCDLITGKKCLKPINNFYF